MTCTLVLSTLVSPNPRHGGQYSTNISPIYLQLIRPTYLTQVINPRSALLSNHEVLTLLRELDSDHLARTKTAIRIKKEEDSSGNVIGRAAHDPTTDDVSENLRTVEIEVRPSHCITSFEIAIVEQGGLLQAIQYLSADYQPTISQTSEGITKLVKDLAPYELTKAEKLQVVNLAPTEPVELYVVRPRPHLPSPLLFTP